MYKPFSIIGGKHLITKRLVNIVNIYNYDYYIEPYVGSGTLFFYSSFLNVNKKTKVIINDYNNTITNFYKVLQTKPKELTHLLKYQIYSRSAFLEAVNNLNNPSLSELERAKNFYIFIRGKLPQGELSKKNQTFKLRIKDATLHNLHTHIDRFDIFHRILHNVVIENKDAISLMDYWINIINDRKNKDSDKKKKYSILIYLDPPYLMSECNTKHIYNGDSFDSDVYHEKLLNFINRYKNHDNIHILLSGYKSTLYDTYLKDWHIKKYKVPVSTSSHKQNKAMRYVTEYLWGNVKYHKYYKNNDDDVYRWIVYRKFKDATINTLTQNILRKTKFYIQTSEQLHIVLNKLIEDGKINVSYKDIVWNKNKGYTRKIKIYNINN